MQKACGHGTSPLPLLVGIRFQVLFHSPNRGSFHLSLTVLVHYRSPRVFSLGKWTYLLPAGLACPAVLKVTAGVFTLLSTGLSPSLVGLSSAVRLEIQLPFCRPYNPRLARPDEFGLFPFRSPLLRKSLLFSLPPGT